MKQDVAFSLVLEENCVLLVRQAYGLRLWTLPGGKVEPEESYAGAAVRELQEETGLTGVALGLVCLRTRANQTMAVFSTEITGGALQESAPGEIEAVGWFDLPALEQNTAVDLFSSCVARRALTQELVVLPYEPWVGGSGDADLFFS